MYLYLSIYVSTYYTNIHVSCIITRCRPVTLRTRRQLYNHKTSMVVLYISANLIGVDCWFELFMKPIKEKRFIHSLSTAKGTSKKSFIDRCLLSQHPGFWDLPQGCDLLLALLYFYTQYFIWTCCPTFNKCNNNDELQLVSQLKLLLKAALLHPVLSMPPMHNCLYRVRVGI